jgi:hypothetical protein
VPGEQPGSQLPAEDGHPVENDRVGQLRAGLCGLRCEVGSRGEVPGSGRPTVATRTVGGPMSSASVHVMVPRAAVILRTARPPFADEHGSAVGRPDLSVTGGVGGTRCSRYGWSRLMHPCLDLTRPDTSLRELTSRDTRPGRLGERTGRVSGAHSLPLVNRSPERGRRASMWPEATEGETDASSFHDPDPGPSHRGALHCPSSISASSRMLTPERPA